MLYLSLSLIKNIFRLETVSFNDLNLKNKYNISVHESAVINTIFKTDSFKNRKGISLVPNIFNTYGDKIQYYINNYIYPTPIELSFIDLNRRLFFLYYALRVLRMVYRGLIRAVRVLFSWKV